MNSSGLSRSTSENAVSRPPTVRSLRPSENTSDIAWNNS
jgi:hypothetical protein